MKAKKTVRILCALFAAVLCLSCVSASAFAAKETVNYNGGNTAVFAITIMTIIIASSCTPKPKWVDIAATAPLRLPLCARKRLCMVNGLPKVTVL